MSDELVEKLIAAALSAATSSDPEVRRQEITAAFKPGDDLGNGLVAVPKVATAAMRETGQQQVNLAEGEGYEYLSRDEIADIYRAMIEAAAEQTKTEGKPC